MKILLLAALTMISPLQTLKILMNLRIRFIQTMINPLFGAVPPSAEKPSQSAPTPRNLTMPMACARTAIMRRVAPRWPPSVTTRIDPCMREGSAKIATSACITNKNEMSRKLRSSNSKLKSACRLARNKQRSSSLNTKNLSKNLKLPRLPSIEMFEGECLS